MNFIERIIAAGFVEQTQKKMLELMPHKARFIPRWWEHYPVNRGWLGLDTAHPDAMFQNVTRNKEVIISLQGVLAFSRLNNEDFVRAFEQHGELFKNRAVRYICFVADQVKVYETFSGIMPPEELVARFISDHS